MPPYVHLLKGREILAINPIRVNNIQPKIPTAVIRPWLEEVKEKSVIASLIPSSPVLFGETEAFTFDTGEAEIIGEGDKKSSNDLTVKKYVTNSFTLQKTVRFSRQLDWADKSHRLNIINRILDTLAPALARGFDYAALYGVNPKTGEASTYVPHYVAETTQVVSAGTRNGYEVLDEAAGIIAGNGYSAQHIALAPDFAHKISTARDIDGRRLYDSFSPVQGSTSSIEGLKSVVGTPVAGKILTGDRAALAGTKAFVGDFNALKWGLVTDLGLQKIEYGDPDGRGDLMRTNELAFRVEAHYGFGIADPNAFVRVTA